MVWISTLGENSNNCLPIVWATWIVAHSMTSKEGWWGPNFWQSYNIWLIHVPTSMSTTKSIFLLQRCNNPNMIVGVYSWEPFQGKPTVDLFNFFIYLHIIQNYIPFEWVKFSRHITSCKVQGWTVVILAKMVQGILTKCICFEKLSLKYK